MKDLTVALENEPGALADAFEALAGAGISMLAASGSVVTGEGIVHILVEDEAAARGALEAAGLVVREERDVVVVDHLPERPGTAGAVVRRAADQGVNLDLAYLTEDGRFVLGSGDVPALERATRSSS